MILRELGILDMFKLLFDLDLVIILLFNLFFKCDVAKAQLLFKILCNWMFPGFELIIFWWLYILDSCDLLILLFAWILYVLDIIGDCDCDITLFPTFF